MSYLSIVIPAFNEENCIEDMIDRTLGQIEEIKKQSSVTDVELIIVNDASSDKTPSIVESYKDKNVRLINHEFNSGYGAALKTGFENAKGNFLTFYDADGTYRPEFLPELCKATIGTNADIVIGSRMSSGKSQMPFTRFIGNKIFAILLSWITNRKITDTASGMRMFKQEILLDLYPLPDGLNFTPAMSTRALHEGMNVVEIPMPYDERVGRSKLGVFKDGFRFLNSIIQIASSYNPLKFFGFIGVILLVIGLLLSIDPVSYYISVRRVEYTALYRLLTIMVLFVTGINIIMFGVFSTYALSLVHQKQVYDNSLLGKLFLRKAFINNSCKIGIAFIAIAVLLNYNTIYQYVSMRKIYVPWPYILTGATLFLTGLQLVMGSFLVKTMDGLYERKRHIEKKR